MMEKWRKVLLFTLVLTIINGATSDEYSLKAISVVFRHGDRTPEPYPKGFYPNDPYKNVSFDPVKPGDLTNNGKRREYQIGTSLRDRYDTFLGDTYRSSDLSVVSTDYERTRMSLLLVLAGLYPPKDKQVWKDNLDWQPIPVNSVPTEISTYLKPKKCPTYVNELNRVKDSKEYKDELSRFTDLMKNLTVLTGRDIRATDIIYTLFHTLTAEKAMNFTLPEWTKAYFPNGPIIDATLFEYKTSSYNELLTKLNGGLFVKKVLDDTVLKGNRTFPKVHLYSVHENNIAAVLQALNIWNNTIPEYSSAVVFELYENNSQYFWKIVYYKGIPAEFKEMTVPGCSDYCPLDSFMDKYKNVLPDDVLEACFGPSSDSLLVPKSVNPVEWIYNKIREWFNL